MKENKTCPICKTKFERPSGKSDKVWNNQDCCGRSCSAISRRKDVLKRPARRKELIPGEGRYLGWSKGKIEEKTKFGGLIHV